MDYIANHDGLQPERRKSHDKDDLDRCRTAHDDAAVGSSLPAAQSCADDPVGRQVPAVSRPAPAAAEDRQDQASAEMDEDRLMTMTNSKCDICGNPNPIGVAATILPYS